MSPSRIQVVARLRPEPQTSSRELRGEKVVTVDATKKTISVPVRKSVRSAIDHSADGWIFPLDAILDETTTQQQAFDQTVAPTVDALLDGYNGTVLAYGQTGAGKVSLAVVPCRTHLTPRIRRFRRHTP